jgi:hypothetical protein
MLPAVAKAMAGKTSHLVAAGWFFFALECHLKGQSNAFAQDLVASI